MADPVQHKVTRLERFWVISVKLSVLGRHCISDKSPLSLEDITAPVVYTGETAVSSL